MIRAKSSSQPPQSSVSLASSSNVYHIAITEEEAFLRVKLSDVARRVIERCHTVSSNEGEYHRFALVFPPQCSPLRWFCPAPLGAISEVTHELENQGYEAHARYRGETPLEISLTVKMMPFNSLPYSVKKLDDSDSWAD